MPAAELEAVVRDARRRTLELVADLSEEQLRVPRLEIVNPVLWELGHLGFFYESLVLRELGWVADSLVERGPERFDSARVEHDARWLLDLPGRAATLDYLARVQQHTIAGLRSAAADERAT